MEKVKRLAPADSHFQISAKVKFQIWAFFLEFSASPARLLDSFSMSATSFINKHPVRRPDTEKLSSSLAVLAENSRKKA